ncbi:phenylalanine--tRNA ligase subunit beta [Fluviicola taffensis]|uniref:Phenylalanine--tRNA ligase beta subunit n=1 Tax=Fluviicola taffensis (strain DSM 16823 / NCIMB 13979 / RW262) TaxID=755732 RepID=F2IA91_FLUTR|nr:phenylalanine--tRNA ligase subunit beta [Fluviicola taffensis]AEA45268.1 phenylalanyl-tRNA synthetase beta subunit [Fluviicola taffensis DSM 16823]
MKISSAWLHEFLPLQKSPEELDQLLTDTGLEVEGFETIESVKGGLQGVVVAEVIECEQHPNADRLKVTKVNNGTEILQVVCGAPNVAVGQKVILAQVGATLYPKPDEPLKMKVSKIRDVESHGMLCAEDELGLGTSHDGILVLDPAAKVGMPAAEYLELESDVQIEIGLTPNRADAMGHVGVARDVLAYLACHEGSNAKLQLKETKKPVKEADLVVSVSVENTERCPRYLGITLRDVEVKPSPAWLQNKLRAVGLSPINNVVDVTNYVMRELGTPLHAFDAKVVAGKVIVRTAKSGEKITTLDGVVRELHEEDLVIANGSEAMCIAGVFGGNHSGISDSTTDVFLEAAYFQPVSVRKTAKRHGLSTDASFRFERGVDVDLVPYALERAVQLIQEVAGGKVGMEVVDAYPNPIQKRSVTLRYERCKQLLGHEIEPKIIATILEFLDFEVVKSSSEGLDLLVPNYRIDVDREIDVIEEILRIYGFNLIPLPEKLNTSLVVTSKPDLERLGSNFAEVLAGMGFNEMMNNSLTSPQYAEKLGGNQFPVSKAVSMLNPLSQDLAVMRQSLLFQAMETVAHNQNRQNPDLRLFEFGKTYSFENDIYGENKRLLLLITGNKQEESWSQKQEKTTLFTLKGIVGNLFERLGLHSLLQEESLSEQEVLADGYQLRILKNVVGTVGWANQKVKKHFGVKQDVFVADLDWDAILDSLKLVKVQYKELPKTFEVRRDFSLLLDSKVRFSQIEQIAKKADKKILQKVGLFDVYEGKNLPEGKKSYAVSFTFQDAEQTLKDSQVDGVMNTIRTELEKQLGAELR